MLVALAIVATQAQDYDDEGYGNQGAGAGGGGGSGGNGGEGDSYNVGYGGNDDSYNGNMPNSYQSNLDSDGNSNSPSNYSPQNGGANGGGSDADGDYEGDDNSAAASVENPSVVRVRRSVNTEPMRPAASGEAKLRVKRHGKYYIGPVYTYVKTDKHANFKWGVSTMRASG